MFGLQQVTQKGAGAEKFDLKGAAGKKTVGAPDAAYKARTWTDEEIAEKLVGYIKMPPKFWPQIKPGDHVRYYTKNDEFRSGGFVQKNPHTHRPQGQDEEKTCMILKNGFDQNAAVWMIYYENTSTIFIKLSAAMLSFEEMYTDAVKKLSSNISIVHSQVAALGARVAALERAAGMRSASK